MRPPPAHRSAQVVIWIVFSVAPTTPGRPPAASTTTTRDPSAEDDPTVTVAVIVVPSPLTEMLETVIVVSTEPLLSRNLMALAPVKFAPVMMIVPLEPLDLLDGEMDE